MRLDLKDVGKQLMEALRNQKRHLVQRHKPLLSILLCAALVVAFQKVYAANFALKGGAGMYVTIGNYFDQDFRPGRGWRTFSSHGFDLSKVNLADYAKYYDIVTLGDSLSFGYGVSGGETYWQDYLNQMTGLSNLIGHHNHHASNDILQAVLDSPTFKKTPPRFVIYESVEYSIPSLAKLEPLPSVPAVPRQGHDASAECRPVKALPVTDSKLDRNGIRDARAAMGRLSMAFLRWATGYRSTIKSGAYVFESRLVRSDLFSNPRGQILLHSNLLRPLPPDRIKRVAAVLESYRQRVEANGVTRFIVAIAPMKENLYAPWLADFPPPLEGQLDKVRTAIPFPTVDLKPAFRALIAKGVPDVIIPGDEHPGPEGHEVIARALLDFMSQNGWLNGCPTPRKK